MVPLRLQFHKVVFVDDLAWEALKYPRIIERCNQMIRNASERIHRVLWIFLCNYRVSFRDVLVHPVIALEIRLYEGARGKSSATSPKVTPEFGRRLVTSSFVQMPRFPPPSGTVRWW